MLPQDLRILKMAPLAFLTKYNVSPPNSYNAGKLGDKTFPGENPNASAYLNGTLTAVDSVLKMKDADRISWAELIRKSGDAYDMKIYNLKQLNTQQQQNMLPIWYLPWKADSITKMKIPMKQNGVDTPDIFFTSSLSGCSIFVKGPANNPTVFHAGSSDSRDWAANPKLDPDTVRHWQILFDRHKPNTVNVGEANKRSYLAELKDSPDMQVYLNFLKGSAKGNLTIQGIVGQGTVFGVRDAAGNWSFYLQHKLTVQYTTFTVKKKLGGLLGKETIQGGVQYYERPMSVQQIFPTGPGQAKIFNTEPVVIR